MLGLKRIGTLRFLVALRAVGLRHFFSDTKKPNMMNFCRLAVLHRLRV